LTAYENVNEKYYLLKDVMPFSFRSELFTFHMHIKYYRKNEFVENVWPANSAIK